MRIVGYLLVRALMKAMYLQIVLLNVRASKKIILVYNLQLLSSWEIIYFFYRTCYVNVIGTNIAYSSLMA